MPSSDYLIQDTEADCVQYRRSSDYLIQDTEDDFVWYRRYSDYLIHREADCVQYRKSSAYLIQDMEDEFEGRNKHLSSFKILNHTTHYYHDFYLSLPLQGINDKYLNGQNVI